MQSRAQFSLWAVMSAPLMLGANIQKITPYDVETYSSLAHHSEAAVSDVSAYVRRRLEPLTDSNLL